MSTKDVLNSNIHLIVLGEDNANEKEMAFLTDFKTGPTNFVNMYENEATYRKFQLPKVINVHLQPSIYQVCFDIMEKDGNSKIPRGIERKLKAKRKFINLNF